jgi:hypothetical protein
METGQEQALIRQELNKLADEPSRGRVQGDGWDRLSNFIFREHTLAGVRGAGRRATAASSPAVAPRSVCGLHHFGAGTTTHTPTSAQLLQMFLAHPRGGRPEADRRHRTIDFYLREIPFDLKVSRFPAAYPQDLKYAWQHRHHLAAWQYAHQSKQGRYHTGNRLFVVLHHRANPEQSWQLRRDFAAMSALITNFLTAPVLLGLTVTHHQTGEVYRPWAGVIFHVT